MRVFNFFTDSLCFLYFSILSLLDIRSRRVPDSVLAAFFISLFALDVSHSYEKIILKLCLGSLFFAIFLVTALISKGLGIGDCKLSFIAGYEFGFIVSAFGFSLAAIFALFFCVICRLLNKKVEKIPFVPFITVGIMITSLICRCYGEIS